MYHFFRCWYAILEMVKNENPLLTNTKKIHMSLYNVMFGENMFANYLLKCLGEKGILNPPRYRDCYIENGQICVLTRTGGGNRDDYEDKNDKMKNHPLYYDDRDCDWDETYACFFYSFPNELCNDLVEIERLLNALKSARDGSSSKEPDTLFPFSAEFCRIFEWNDEKTRTIIKAINDTIDEVSNSQKK